MQASLLAASPTQATDRPLPPSPPLAAAVGRNQTNGNPPFNAAVIKALTGGAATAMASCSQPQQTSAEAAPTKISTSDTNAGASQRTVPASNQAPASPEPFAPLSFSVPRVGEVADAAVSSPPRSSTGDADLASEDRSLAVAGGPIAAARSSQIAATAPDPVSPASP